MLNNLFRKLHILFASSVMLIITLVIAFVVANMVHTERMILSILVDTFLSRISLTMLPAPNLHNTSCVLS